METYPEITAAYVATRPRPITHVIRGAPQAPDFVQMITQLREEFAARLAERHASGRSQRSSQ
jgi:hypothetical protein